MVGPWRVAGDRERVERKRAALLGFDETDRRRGAAETTARDRCIRLASASHAEAIAATGERTHDIGGAEAVDRGLRAREHRSRGLDFEQRRLRRIDVHQPPRRDEERVARVGQRDTAVRHLGSQLRQKHIGPGDRRAPEPFSRFVGIVDQSDRRPAERNGIDTPGIVGGELGRDSALHGARGRQPRFVEFGEHPRGDATCKRWSRQHDEIIRPLAPLVGDGFGRFVGIIGDGVAAGAFELIERARVEIVGVGEQTDDLRLRGGGRNERRRAIGEGLFRAKTADEGDRQPQSRGPNDPRNAEERPGDVRKYPESA